MNSKKISRIWIVSLVILLAGPAVAWASGGSEGNPEEASLVHRMMMLALQLGAIIFVAKLGSLFFEKLKLPGVLGELFSGMLIGAYALGGLPFFGFPHGLFPIYHNFPVSPELYGLGSLAAIVLLFNVGLETDLKLMMRYSVAGGLVGIGGVAFSFLLGAATMKFFAPSMLGQTVGLFDPVCLFMGTASTATSVGITARILSEKRKLDSPEGVTILSAAVIDDVIGMIILAVVMSMISASKASGAIDWGHIGIIAAKAVGVWLVATALGLIASRKISFLLKWFGEKTSIAIMALGLALILAGLFEEAGLAMIIGAYVMGLSLSRTDVSHVVQEKLHPIFALLVPIFFCTTGMLIDFKAMGSRSVLVFGLAYTATAFIAKVVGCGLPALLANFNLRGALRIGTGMAPRGEVGLIIAGIGVLAGLLSSELFAAVIIMVVVNTVISPPLLVGLFHSPKRGTRKPTAQSESQTRIDFEFPSMEMAEFFVRKLIDVFESEGFFVHQISPERRIYQLRKDKSIIDFRLEGEMLIFDCEQQDVRLINTAVYEALAELERSIRGLKKPLDAKPIQTRIQDTGPLGPENINMGQYLTPHLIETRLRGTNKAEIIDELLNILHGNGRIQDVDAARRAVWEREESMSTGLQYGVAIPHGKTDTVNSLVCAIGIHPDGVDFNAMDHQPSRIFILTLSPKSKPAPHIQFMSAISHILNDTGREYILSCKSAWKIHRAFVHPQSQIPSVPSRPQEPQPLSEGKFNPIDYIRPELLEPNLQGETPTEIICELLTLMEQANLLHDTMEAADVVMEREALMSTSMGEGVAIPHGRTDTVDGLVCAIGVKKEGIDFGAGDKKLTRIFVLVLTPLSGADPYLQLVASMMSVLDETGRQQMLSADSREALYDVIRRKLER